MSSACLGVEEKSLFGGDGLSLEKLFYKSNKNKAPGKSRFVLKSLLSGFLCRTEK